MVSSSSIDKSPWPDKRIQTELEILFFSELVTETWIRTSMGIRKALQIALGAQVYNKSIYYLFHCYYSRQYCMGQSSGIVSGDSPSKGGPYMRFACQVYPHPDLWFIDNTCQVHYTWPSPKPDSCSATWVNICLRNSAAIQWVGVLFFFFLVQFTMWL